LPYQITYAKNSKLQMEIVAKYSKMIKAIWNEKKDVASWMEQYDFDGIISDNRLGVLIKRFPVYL
jgi:hypothetical protein